MRSSKEKRRHADLHEAYQALLSSCKFKEIDDDVEDDEEKPIIAAFSVEQAFVEED